VSGKSQRIAFWQIGERRSALSWPSHAPIAVSWTLRLSGHLGHLKERRMKRFHVHLAVSDLIASTAFYRELFGEPARVEPDYVKWIVNDPCLNFAISARGSPPGINHLGIQVESEAEMLEMHERLQQADSRLRVQEAAQCCYATSDKYWITDPEGIAWETFHTLGTIPVYGEDLEPRGTPRPKTCGSQDASKPQGAAPAQKACC